MHPMPAFLRSTAATFALLAPALLAPCPALAADAVFFGPTPYLSAADTPDGFASGAMAIEDFEDGSVDSRLVRSTSSITPPGGITDSVDADDGAIDGSGNGGTSLFGASIRIGFTEPLPSAAGMVWTDGAAADVTFEAFGPDGQSLGSVGPVPLGDGSISGTTAEDRFFGARHAGGISAIAFTSAAVMEIDHVQYDAAGAVEPAIASTLEDGNLALLLPTPDGNLPSPAQTALALPVDARPHGLAFLGARSALFSDFAQPRLFRVALDDAGTVQTIALSGRSNGNGSLAVEPHGMYALSIGESNGAERVGEAVVLNFSVDPPLVTPMPAGLRVRGFVTAAIDFAPDRRAFVCHVNGVSVLRPPYTAIDIALPFPPVLASPSMCRLTRDGTRLFVTRMLSETEPTVNAIRTTAAPFSAASTFVEIPAPPDVQGLGPMAVSPDGQALIVGQQFLLPPAFAGARARAFIVRAPFDENATWTEIELPPGVNGSSCSDDGAVDDCPGFEHIEVSADGSLAILTGNSSSELAGAADAVPAVFVRNPFDDATRSAVAVQLAPEAGTPGRGAGGVRFRPARIFGDGFE
ncbi:hypothetical protein [Chiayiivirga flava]|uniref:Uncharacterized protein n=1 Tax=Chiayiivirga flava TaxID=659595 RepID=A0A7W8D5N6_9GAMM|nr:hypothetical protein [Chiayiivirga flava]MBB5208378.1 hypothetical protein [Chiayiivirga flava]